MDVIGNRKIKYLWISNVLPMNIVEELNLSVAGKKMELSILKQLDQMVDCDVVSVSFQGKTQSIRDGFKLWDNKPYVHFSQENTFIAFAYRNLEKEIYDYAVQWCTKYSAYEKRVIVLNAPLFAVRPLLKLKKKFDLNLFSILVDLPQLPHPKTLGQKIMHAYHRRYISKAHRSLEEFDGLVGVNENVRSALGLHIPFHKMLIGIDLDFHHAKYESRIQSPYKIAFAGTLVDYNGIGELLETVAEFDPNMLELHIYGYGPLERQVKEYCQRYSHIKFHGQVANSRIMSILEQMDILVNPRKTNLDISDYSFPSKIVEYLATGKPVISTRFSAMPAEYEKIVFLIDRVAPKELKNRILDIIQMPKADLDKRSQMAIDFVSRKHQYKYITLELLRFMDERKSFSGISFDKLE